MYFSEIISSHQFWKDKAFHDYPALTLLSGPLSSKSLAPYPFSADLPSQIILFHLQLCHHTSFSTWKDFLFHKARVEFCPKKFTWLDYSLSSTQQQISWENAEIRIPDFVLHPSKTCSGSPADQELQFLLQGVSVKQNHQPFDCFQNSTRKLLKLLIML